MRNRILTALPFSDFDSIRPLLLSVPLESGCVLTESNKRIEHIDFVESGVVSLMTLANGNILETATVGFHGAVGASIVLGPPIAMHRSVVSVAGKAWRIKVGDLCCVMERHPQIREQLLRYLQSLMVHVSQTALCGVRHELSRRLACWLCVACESLGHETLPLTHDHLSFFLGLRRAGITEALAQFEELGIVRKARGVLQIRDRVSLQQQACGCYEVIANSYGLSTPVAGFRNVVSRALVNS